MASALAWKNKRKIAPPKLAPKARSFVIGLFYALGTRAGSLPLATRSNKIILFSDRVDRLDRLDYRKATNRY